MLIILGLLIELFFGTGAAISLDSLHQIETTTADPWSNPAYMDARSGLIFDAVASGIGLLVMAIGLVVLVRWRPSSVLVPASSSNRHEVAGFATANDPYSLWLPVLPGGLAFAGWLSLATAILEIPLSAINEALRNQGGREVIYHSFYYAISIPLYAYPLWQLKRLLNVRWGFQEANRVLDWLIGLILFGLLVGIGMDMVGTFFGRAPEPPAPGPVESTFVLVFGVILYLPVIWLYVNLGMKIRHLGSSLFGLARAFSLTCFATVLYLPMGFWREAWLLASVVFVLQYGVLGVVFIKASRDRHARALDEDRSLRGATGDRATLEAAPGPSPQPSTLE